MPAARSAKSDHRNARPESTGRGQRPRGLGNRLPTSRVRWDRKLRVIMLLVLGLVGWVGAHGAMELLRTRAQANEEQSLVVKLERQNRQLEQQASSLNQPATIIRAARALGMVKAGERAYVITGLPGN